MRKRVCRFSYVAKVHREKQLTHAQKGSEQVKKTRAKLEVGKTNCSQAFEFLVEAAKELAKAAAHRESAEDKAPNIQAKATLNGAIKRFDKASELYRAKCVVRK